MPRNNSVISDQHLEEVNQPYGSQKRNCLIFFDGTAQNINSEVEKKYGKSIIAEFFTDTKATSLDVIEDVISSTPVGYDQFEDIKAYFPGPGAEHSEHENPAFCNPGNPGHHDYLPQGSHKHLRSNPKAKTSRFCTVNQYYGYGWEHNLFNAVNLISNIPLDQFDIFVAGFSRGAITAISFSNELSKMGITIKHLFLIDPVAGFDYGHVKNFFNYDKADRNGLPQVNPFIIGSKVKKLDIFYATLELRGCLTCQLPMKYMNGSKNPNPLLIHDMTETRVHFLPGDHSQVSHREFKNEGRHSEAGKYVYRQIYTSLRQYGIKVFTYDNNYSQHNNKVEFQDIPYQPPIYGNYRMRPIAHFANNSNGFMRDNYFNSYENDLMLIMLDFLKYTAPKFLNILQEVSNYPNICRAICHLTNNYHALPFVNRPGSARKPARCKPSKKMQEFIKEVSADTSIFYKGYFNTNRKGRHLKILINDVNHEKENWNNFTEVTFLRKTLKIALVVRGSFFAREQSSSGQKALELINTRYLHYKRIISNYISHSHHEDLQLCDLMTFLHLDGQQLAKEANRQKIYNDIKI
ncbi:MAG: hypothetical protein GY750_06385 [Lentisphaerae bacterium]|nr:hypothetical protein [Lentisphaerota bacterium]MCP4101036.1 hypothetical protein [Lentisphaerota bacterium]